MYIISMKKLHSLAWRHIEFRGRAGKGLGTRVLYRI